MLLEFLINFMLKLIYYLFPPVLNYKTFLTILYKFINVTKEGIEKKIFNLVLKILTKKSMKTFFINSMRKKNE
jgi:hypothetical protein